MLTNTELEDIKMLINLEKSIYNIYINLSNIIKNNNKSKKEELIAELKSLSSVEENILNRLITSEEKLTQIEKYLLDNKYISKYGKTETELINKNINKVGFNKLRLANRIQKSKFYIPKNLQSFLIKPTNSERIYSYIFVYLYDKDFYNLISYYLYQELDKADNNNKKGILIDKIISLCYLEKEQEIEDLNNDFEANKVITLVYDYVTSKIYKDNSLGKSYKQLKVSVLFPLTIKPLMIPDVFHNVEASYGLTEYLKAIFKSYYYLADTKTKENIIKQIEILKNTPQGQMYKKSFIVLNDCINEVETSKNQIYTIKSLVKN